MRERSSSAALVVLEVIAFSCSLIVARLCAHTPALKVQPAPGQESAPQRPAPLPRINFFDRRRKGSIFYAPYAGEIAQDLPIERRMRPMVDGLKLSLEQLVIPICTNCLNEMRWIRSTLVAPEPVAIEHHFACLSCDRVVETTTTLSPCKRSGTSAPLK
jgi:hypothetical protein